MMVAWPCDDSNEIVLINRVITNIIIVICNIIIDMIINHDSIVNDIINMIIKISITIMIYSMIICVTDIIINMITGATRLESTESRKEILWDGLGLDPAVLSIMIDNTLSYVVSWKNICKQSQINPRPQGLPRIFWSQIAFL